MSILASKKIELYGRKILCIDDDIAPSENERGGFLHSCYLKEEDVIFTSAYSSALNLLEENSDIGLAIVDIRIPKNPEDLEDFNPENPGKEWGIKLLEEIDKISSQKNLVDKYRYAMSAYPRSTLAEHKIELLAREFYGKPINHKALAQDIKFIANKYWKKQFNYSVYDQETSIFLQQRAEEIHKLVKRTAEDVFNIGTYLIEVKDKLGHGNFLNWLLVEFNWSYRTASRFMNVARKFDLDTVSKYAILPSALYELGSPSTPVIAVSEAFELAQEGKVITKKIATELISKYKNPEPNNSGNTESSAKKEVKSPKNHQKTTKSKTNLVSKNLAQIEQPKQAILKVISTTKITQDSWWQLGEEHQLFCGEPKSEKFLEKLPPKIALAINFPPNSNFSLIPVVKFDSTLTLSSNQNNINLEAVVKTVKDWMDETTQPKDIVVFSYLFDLKVLAVAVERGCSCFIAEPDLEKCDRILEYWREKDSVKKIIST